MRQFSLFILVILLAGCTNIGTGKVIMSPTPTAASSSNKVIFIGHRGAAGEAPENTLASFQRALDVGVDVVELDVHLSSDDQLVVIHDPRLDRTTDGRGMIHDLTLAELKRLNASIKYQGLGDYGVQRIPTLQEVYDVVGTRAAMLIEIKLDATNNRYPGIEQKVVDLVRRNNAVGTTTIGSFDFATLQEIQRLESQLRRTAFISTAYLSKMGLSRKGPAEIAADLTSGSAQSVGVEKSFLAEQLVSALKQSRIGVGAWTVDDFVEMWKLIDLGVETITTNRPSLLMEKYRQGRNP